MKADVAISVIVPVYKVERFISRCVNSLFSQSMQDNIEFIFVDDASPDKSLALVEQCLKYYPKRKKQVRILHHIKNLGLPAARNTGLGIARGEYIYHCDSDDYLETDALEAMYVAATKYDADIVWSDWFLTLDKVEMTYPRA